VSEGQLPKGWARATIGDVVQPTRPKIAPKPTSILPFVGLEHIKPHSMSIDGAFRFCDLKSPAVHFLPGDVLYGRLRPYLNKVAVAEFEGACSSEFIVLPPTEVVIGAFLKYLLHHARFVSYAAHQVSGDRPRIDFGQIAAFEFGLPPVSEQARIVAAIDALFVQLDTAEEHLTKTQHLLGQYRQSIIRSAYRGDLTQGWRSQRSRLRESAESLLHRLKVARAELAPAARRKGAIDTKRPGVDIQPNLVCPEEWVWTTLGDISEVVGGLTKDSKRKPKDGVEAPYLRVANVQRGFLDLSEVKTILATPDELKALKLQRGDILLNEGGDLDKLGRGWVWEEQLEACIHQNHVFRARIFVNEVPAAYISRYINEFCQPFFMSQGTQTTNLASVSMSKVRQVPIPIPPLEELIEIDRYCVETLDETEGLSTVVGQKRELLKVLRQSALVAAFSGELVKQDSTDEPVGDLLQRTISCRETGVARQRARKSKKVAA